MSSAADAFLLRVGSRIAKVRHTRNLTQSQLAEEIGVDARSLQRIEAGRAAPSLQRLREIAAALEVSVSSLFEGASSYAESRGSAAREERNTRPEHANLLRVWERIPESRRVFALKVLRLLGNESFE